MIHKVSWTMYYGSRTKTILLFSLFYWRFFFYSWILRLNSLLLNYFSWSSIFLMVSKQHYVASKSILMAPRQDCEGYILVSSSIRSLNYREILLQFLIFPCILLTLSLKMPLIWSFYILNVTSYSYWGLTDRYVPRPSTEIESRWGVRPCCEIFYSSCRKC